MKVLLIATLVTLYARFAFAQGKPVPRGVHEAEQASARSEKNAPPPEMSGAVILASDKKMQPSWSWHV